MLSLAIWSRCVEHYAEARYQDDVSAQKAIAYNSARILHLDEALTMSARMAAATGDRMWIDRYRRLAPELNRLIDRTADLATSARARERIAALDHSNSHLVRLECESFKLVTAGRRKEAWALLTGPEYLRHKAIYSSAVNAFLREVAADQESRSRTAAKSDRLRFLLQAVLNCLALSLWLLALWRIGLGWKRNCAKLRESEANISTTLHSIADAVIATDADGRVVRMNPAAERMTGWVLSEAVGRPISDVLAIVNAETREPAPIPIDEVLSTGRVCHLADHTTLISRDGAERQIADSAAPIRDGSGAIVGAVLVFSDVTEQYRVRQALLDSESRLRAIADSAQDAILIMDPEGLIAYWNAAAERMLGYTSAEAIGQELHSFIAPSRYYEAYRAAFPTFQQTGRGSAIGKTLDLEARRKDGEEISVQLSLSAIHINGGWHAVGILRDVTERKQMEEELHAAKAQLEAANRRLEAALLAAKSRAADVEAAKERIEGQAFELAHQATHDALTGLPNRKYLEQHLGDLVAGRSGKKSRRLVVLFLDLDRFKLINDTLGHRVGDLLLVEAGRRLQSCLRSGDFLARLGGDEFTVILPRCRSRSIAESVASRIIDSISRPFEIEGQRFVIGATIGLASYPSDGRDVVSLLRHADAAMYQAKQAGRGTLRWFAGHLDLDNQQRADISADVRTALEKGQFVVYYQPIVSLEDGSILAAEALLRWEHPEKGLISPSLFIPIAEEIGIIGRIGDYVLRTACAQTMAWRNEGIHLSQIAVNVSPTEILDVGWPDTVSGILAETGLEARCLNLELTENDFAADCDSITKAVQRMQELGVCLSIDDFGMGRSSLGRLKNLPVTQLKIDGSFLRDIEHSEDDGALVRSIVEMAHAQGIKVTAEWVETEPQMEILRSMGCDFAQGYIISPALSAEAFGRFVREWQQRLLLNRAA